MNEIAIAVNYENEKPTVSGRELHKVLKIDTPYHKWFPRMRGYGFTEGMDYWTFLSNRSDGLAGKPKTDHQLTIDMAKELCMIQRTEIGKKCREYFLDIERRWNSPETVMARALQFAGQRLELLTQENSRLTEINIAQAQQIAEMQPKVTYHDIVLNCKELVTVNTIAKDYGKSAVWLNKWLHEHGIQYKQGKIWHLYQKYAKKGYAKSRTLPFADGAGKNHSRSRTCWTQKGRLFIYELLKENGILPLIEQEGGKK